LHGVPCGAYSRSENSHPVLAKQTDRVCANTKPHSQKDIHLGDGDGLYLRVRPCGTRAWVVDYVGMAIAEYLL